MTGPAPGRLQRRKMAQRNWYARLAEAHSFVPSPTAGPGVPRLMHVMAPRAFSSVAVARKWADRRPIEIVLAHWGENVAPARVRLGNSVWVDVLVEAKDAQGAGRVLRFALPDDAEIEA